MELACVLVFAQQSVQPGPLEAFEGRQYAQGAVENVTMHHTEREVEHLIQ